MNIDLHWSVCHSTSAVNMMTGLNVRVVSVEASYWNRNSSVLGPDSGMQLSWNMYDILVILQLKEIVMFL